MSLGEKLKSLRVKSCKTLKEQGTIFGVSMNTIYRWEHDFAVPRKPKLKKIADHYSVPLDWLLSDSATAALVSDTEQKLLGMFRELSENNKFKTLGYIEHMCVEQIGASNGNGREE